MASPSSIAPDKLARLIGTPRCPVLIDVRLDEDVKDDPFLVPGAMRRDYRDVAAWSPTLQGRSAVIICQKGLKLSHGVAAWLRQVGIPAEALEGGALEWRRLALPRLPLAQLPTRTGASATLWVTRERPKIDRVACPWLIRRFVDPAAVFLFVKPSEVLGVAERFAATPFDVEDVFWSHRGDRCTFDTMVEEWGLATPALIRLATIIRGADTARLDLAPEAAGLLAVSLGLSRMYADDNTQLDAGLVLYDALYRWCRDATDETHHWPARRQGT